MSGGHLSKEFFELVKSIGESRSKQEEDKIIVGEIAILKQHLSSPNISARKMKEYMIRAVYAEMLGHDAAFAYIHAVKLAHEKNLFAKRIGYLTCNLFLHRDHELMLLLINTMQRDLQSSNHLEVCAALTSVCRLVNMEMIPAIAPIVFKLLSHQQEAVRKKAVVAANKIFKLVPETVLDQKDQIRKVLCDPDPSVMGASLHVLYEVAKHQPAASKDLVPSFVSILKQITEHRLPRDFDYHRMPAPWLQVKLLSILSILGTADQKSSEHMYEILQECMRRADSGVNVGYAIIYECVKCVTKIYPDHGLLELAASNISRFISSENHNLRYLGVTGLAQIVQVNPTYAAEHQMVVVDCLEDPDETLKRKTLDLLFRMTNPQNVIVVADKLTFHLRTSVDTHLRRELVQKLTSLAERFAPNNEWYVNTMNTVFELGGELVPAETAYNLMRLVAEGTEEDESADSAFRTFAVNTYLKLLEKSSVSDILVQVIAWVLGEYARLANVDGYTTEDIVDLLADCLERPFEDPSTRGYLVTALMKLIGQLGVQCGSAERIIRSYRSSRMTDLQQRCYEFDQLRQTPALMRKVLPFDASCEDIAVDKDLTFLDGFVAKKQDEGAKSYMSAYERAARAEDSNSVKVPEDSKPSLNFTPYEVPTKPQAAAPMPDFGGDMGGYGGSVEEPQAPKGLNVSGPRKWGPSGYNQPGGAKPDPPPQERPSAPQPSVPQAPQPTFTAPKPVEPAAMSEKQKMAAALFGGVGPTAAPAPASAPPAKTFSAPAPAPAPTPAPVRVEKVPEPAPAPAAIDLLDLDDFGGSAPTQAAAPPAQPAFGGDALLDMDDLVSTPVAQPALQPVLGPLQVTTAQVGATWGQLATERRVQLQTSIGNCQEMMSRLQSSLNVAPVEIIGMEGIAAGRVLPGNDPCFLHGKLAPPRLDVLIRCRDAGVANTVAELCQRSMA
mmetsp:Transcript_84403/g.149296  ORF Transcript_84403/g.149296 Transcript_84403/m.149296 type:complete len:951 (+) Transcript_84403:100-2952(+)|eukprot:CAMPEP_0197629342 /NCGR_PEP_ID=MMETSP1338-20131121/7233_1 /TAXON_ID=43686 ORGANISM="Pelagodinium beii, Strain RCC1491" /NCGR_SAMPLE_ID=MMETSP1338 /ASSEMBLY_ACC=CAM_ASM_000754 /LENGTH=950 /DNA_ID=CAMNT_0043200375 /DNA_START=100 /DNA_END=2952 /DNA_ORIENTATION=-